MGKHKKHMVVGNGRFVMSKKKPKEVTARKLSKLTGIPATSIVMATWYLEKQGIQLTDALEVFFDKVVSNRGLSRGMLLGYILPEREEEL